MKINHLHFDSLPSTQTHLKEALEAGTLKLASKDDSHLVSALKQTQGHGRQGKPWVSDHRSLYLSFTLNPHEVFTLSSLEVAVLIAKYFEQNFALKMQLKWPNDLIIHHKKCGGIIIQNFKNDLIVGVGINFHDPDQDFEKSPFDIPATSIGIELKDPQKTAYDLYHFILAHRLGSEEIKDGFERLCAHQNVECTVTQNEQTLKGLFLGIGNNGEAKLLLETKKIIEVYSGTLRF